MNPPTEALKFDELSEDLLSHRREHTKLLEAKIATVAEIMKDCSEVTAAQGNLLDRIDSEVGSASSNSKLVVQELHTARSNQRIKRTCCLMVLIICSIVLLGVIVVALVLGRV